ncbi:MAG: peptide-N-glycosidase [Ignavibacteriales bacterium]|nr:peptide-N-glycosidase [Ignavibacteriales bacterium]
MFVHSSKKIFKSILKLFLIYFIAIGIITAQQSKNEGVVQYSFKNNGKISDRASLKLFYKDGIVGYESSFRRDSEKEKEFINYNDNSTYQLLTIDDGVFYQKKSFSEFEEAKILDETENILGYDCKKAVLKIKSNTIEVWFTNELGIKGSPSTSVAPGLGLILKMVRNRDYETFATNIDFRTLINEELNFDLTNAKEIDGASYYRKLIDSRYQTITVFNREQINYGDTIKNPNEEILDHTYRFSNGTVLLKKIKLPKISNGSTVMAEVNSWSNGDAYDRTGSLFIIPTTKEKSFLDAFKNGIDKVPIYNDNKDNKFQGVITTSNYDPPLELLRFFTPFGVSGFNNYTKIEGYNWADSAKYSQEVTDLIPHNGSEIWIGVFIGNYDKGGHLASLRLKIHPSFRGNDENDKKWIQPIFNTMNIMEMSGQNYGTMFHDDSLEVTVEIPEGLESLSLRYTSTGHGGWGGGDEFNPKMNEIFIDDSLVYKFIPWRDDCATYRLLNPASGNFGNGLTSSDLSRSNWCPGTVTIPEIITLDNLEPGSHTFKIAIPIGEREGGSFSAWNVSGTLIGKFKN